MSVLRIVPPASGVSPIAASDIDAIDRRLRNTITDLDALSELLRKAVTDRRRDRAYDKVTARLLRSADALDDLTAEARQLLDAALRPAPLWGARISNSPDGLGVVFH